VSLRDDARIWIPIAIAIDRMRWLRVGLRVGKDGGDGKE
jgi:hypothetical protein